MILRSAIEHALWVERLVVLNKSSSSLAVEHVVQLHGCSL